MKHILPYITLLITSLLTVGCRGSRDNDSVRYTTPEYIPQYATGFKISGAEGRKSVMLEISNPWQGANSVVTRLFIARNREKAPAGFDGEVLDGGEVLRIVAMSSTHMAMLDAIGEIKRVVGVSGIDYISNPYIQKHRDTVGDVGYEGNVNYERLLALAPDLVLLYGINGASSMESRLKDLGIPYMYVGDYLEEHPLGKAEWIVAIAEIAGVRESGVSRFSEISEKYNRLKEHISQHLDGPQSAPRPNVMINTPYGDTWFMPSAQSYMATLISDAGGIYVYDRDNGNASLPIDIETAFMLTAGADKWINTGSETSIAGLKNNFPKFADTKPVVTNEVYNNTLRSTASGGNDFYESGIVNPHLILQDLIRIFHPGVDSGTDLTYYRQLK